jgi:hypothetical protein
MPSQHGFHVYARTNLCWPSPIHSQFTCGCAFSCKLYFWQMLTFNNAKDRFPIFVHINVASEDPTSVCRQAASMLAAITVHAACSGFIIAFHILPRTFVKTDLMNVLLPAPACYCPTLRSASCSKYCRRLRYIVGSRLFAARASLALGEVHSFPSQVHWHTPQTEPWLQQDACHLMQVCQGCKNGMPDRQHHRMHQ